MLITHHYTRVSHPRHNHTHFVCAPTLGGFDNRAAANAANFACIAPSALASPPHKWWVMHSLRDPTEL